MGVARDAEESVFFVQRLRSLGPEGHANIYAGREERFAVSVSVDGAVGGGGVGTGEVEEL